MFQRITGFPDRAVFVRSLGTVVLEQDHKRDAGRRERERKRERLSLPPNIRRGCLICSLLVDSLAVQRSAQSHSFQNGSPANIFKAEASVPRDNDRIQSAIVKVNYVFLKSDGLHLMCGQFERKEAFTEQLVKGLLCFVLLRLFSHVRNSSLC